MVRRRELPSAQLHIFGQLEARLTESDRVILGGLVEGVWPPAPRIDPWLSRPMRHELGLDLPERRIGLSAHDFAQLLGHERRDPHPFGQGRRRAGGRLALPAPAGSRRRRGALEAGRSEAGDKYVRYAGELDRPRRSSRSSSRSQDRRAQTRPTRLSVTAIEDWLRDPYTIYARHILQARSARSRRHAAVGGRSRLGDPRMRSANSPESSQAPCPTISRACCAVSAKNISRR